MRAFVTFILFLLCYQYAHGQFTTITHLTGTTTYGATSVTVTPSASSASTISYCGTAPYWIGSASSGTTPAPGSYTFNFAPACNALRIYIAAANTGESFDFSINGSRYSLTAANIFAFSGPCGSAAILLSGDSLLTPTVALTPGAATGVYIPYCGISSVTVHTNGLWSGSTFTMTFSDTAVCNSAYSNSAICRGDTLKLFDTGGTITASTSFNWYGPGGYTSSVQFPVIPNATLADSGIYFCVRDGVDTAFTRVVVNPTPPVPSIDPVIPICSGRTLVITANDTVGASYLWAGPNGFTSTLQNPFITGVTTAATGTYTLTCSLGGCQSLPAFQRILIDSTPAVPTISATTPICSSRTIFLYSACATSGVNYNWSGPALYTSTRQNDSIPSAITSQTGYYTITVTKGICSNFHDTFILVNQVPTPPVAGSTSPLCSGNLLTLTAFSSPSTGTYHWTGPNGFTSLVQNPTIPFVTTLATGIYSVYEDLRGCLSDTSYDTVVIYSTPAIPTVWTNSPVCEGDTLKLHASDDTAGVSYSWIGPNSFASTDQHPFLTNVLPTGAGVYTVTATLRTCSITNVLSTDVHAAPPISMTTNSPVCTGDSLILTGISNAGNTFSWVGPYSFVAVGSITTRSPAILEYAGVYTVTATDPLGCHSAGTGTVEVHTTPLPPWVPWSTFCQYAYAPPLMAVNATNVTWFTSSAGGAGTTVAPTPPTDIPGVFFYFLNQVVDGCPSNIDSIQVVVNPKPVTTLTPRESVICPHDTFSYHAVNSDPFVKYHWYPSLYLGDSLSANPLATPIADVNYMVVSTNLFGCSDTESAKVMVFPAALFSLNAVDSVILYPGESFHIQPATNCVSFAWYPTEGLDHSTVSDPIVTPEVDTRYHVRAYTEHGCMVEDSLWFKLNEETILAIPNAFTPGNGINNEFKVIRNGLAHLNYLRVFDRWGVLVFESKDIDAGWDGTYKGKQQPFGVYVYEVQAVSTVTNKVFNLHGNVTLIR